MEKMPPADQRFDCNASCRLSQIFTDLAGRTDASISIRQIRDAIGDRSFAALLVLFAALNLLPLPPGSTLLFGIPLILISAQMVLGHDTAWLPRRFLDKSIAIDRFRISIAKIVPRLEWLERMVRPRYWPFRGGQADRIVGILSLILAIVVTLPIPLGNWLPAFATGIFGLALSERDGVFLGIGVAVTVLAFAVIGLVFGTAGVVANAAFGLHF
ncbi:exopolysaccharide biosynthesis protein [Aquamicrobium sp. LC103]|nr:exopolysaccharide biosynthesis protein [Aquamicrobium sp. LC103]